MINSIKGGTNPIRIQNRGNESWPFAKVSKPPALVDPDLGLAEATDRFQSEYIEQAIRRAHGCPQTQPDQD